MSPEEFKTHLARLGFTQQRFSRWLGLPDASARKVRRWASGALAVPDDIAAGLRAMPTAPLARYVIEAPADRSFTVTLTPIPPACEPVPDPQADISPVSTPGFLANCPLPSSTSPERTTK